MKTGTAMISTVVCGRWNRFSSQYTETVHLRHVRNLFDTQQCSKEILAEAQDAVIKRLLQKLEQTSVTALTDGGIRWDSVYDITRGIEGCQGFTQLTRIPDANHFHRQPVIKLPLSWIQSLLGADYLFAKQHATLPITLSLPGPFSTAYQTQNYEAYGLERVMEHYAKVFNQELKFLLRHKDIYLIRIEEPSLIEYPQQFPLFQKVMRTLIQGLDTSRLALDNKSEVGSFNKYFDLPFAIFFLNFVHEENNPNVLKSLPAGKRIMAGVVDATSPYQESPTEIYNLARSILNYMPRNFLALTSSTDWQGLPWNNALEKIKRLVEASHRV